MFPGPRITCATAIHTVRALNIPKTLTCVVGNINHISVVLARYLASICVRKCRAIHSPYDLARIAIGLFLAIAAFIKVLRSTTNELKVITGTL